MSVTETKNLSPKRIARALDVAYGLGMQEEVGGRVKQSRKQQAIEDADEDARDAAYLKAARAGK
jgi:hypothetical protein